MDYTDLSHGILLFTFLILRPECQHLFCFYYMFVFTSVEGIL